MNLGSLSAFSLLLYATVLPISLSATNFVLGFLSSLGIINLILKRAPFEFPISFYFLLLFFTWAMFTQVISQGFFEINHLKAYGKIWNFFPLLFTPFLKEVPEDKIKLAIKTLILVATLLTLLGAFQYWNEIHFFFEGWFKKGVFVHEKRFYGFQSYPLHTAGLYTILFCLASNLAFNLNAAKSERIFWGISSILIALAVLLTGSRSYYLGMSASLLFIFSFRGWKWSTTFLLAAILGVTLLAKWEPYIQDRVLTINPHHTDESGTQRIYAWKSAWAMIQDHPIKGVGYRKWGENLLHYSQLPSNMELDPAIKGHAHNSFLNITAETGIIGLGLILGFWFCFIKEELNLLKNRAKFSFSYALSLSTLAATLAVLVASLFEHNTFTATVCLSLFFISGLSRLSGKIVTQ